MAPTKYPEISKTRTTGKLLLLAAFTAGSLSLSDGSEACPHPVKKLPPKLGIPPSLGSYPGTFVSLSGNSRVLPDMVPANVIRMNVSTSTDFKGSLEGDPVTGAVRVTNAYPASSYIVVVKEFSSDNTLIGTETFVLHVTSPANPCNSVSFAPATKVEADNVPIAVAVGDFNGDSKQDLAVVNETSNNLSILAGDGAGQFALVDNFATGSEPGDLVVSDFNGDGKQDVAVSNFRSNNVSILLGDGAGHLGTAVNFTVGSEPGPMTVGDFNRDGQPDLAVANCASNNIAILLGNGAGGFNAPINFNVGMFPVSMAMGDFDRDNNQDLAVANFNSPYISILFGNGTGGFLGRAINIGINFNASSITVGDFNADGSEDLAVANPNLDRVAIFIGNGTGSFSNATNFPVLGEPGSLCAGDFNGDGKQDLVACNLQPSNTIAILTGDGSGSFGDATLFGGAGIWLASPVVGDFDGDGKQDIAVAALNSSNVSILLNNCTNPNLCSVCHKQTTTITVPCNSLEYRTHLDHGDTPGACPE